VIERYTMEGDRLVADVVMEDPLIMTEPVRFRFEFRRTEDALVEWPECDPEQSRAPLNYLPVDQQRLLLCVAAAGAAAGLHVLTAPASAHHAEAPFYDVEKTVETRGVVTKWEFRNPHPFLYSVARADGTVIPGSGRGGT
jgi:hypothetical protein